MRRSLSFVLLCFVSTTIAATITATPAQAHSGHQVSIATVAAQAEGSGGGTQNATVAVTVSPAPQIGETLEVKWATSDATPSTAVSDTDYDFSSGTVTFNGPLEDSQTVTVPIVRDGVDESNETFLINLFFPRSTACGVGCTSPSTVSIAPGQGTSTVTITDDDVPSFTINNVTAPEGDTGTTPPTPFGFVVTRAVDSDQTVTVDFVTANGSAAAPDDYAANAGTLSFAPGEFTKPVTVQVVGDTTNEPNETFLVNLSNATNPGRSASIADAQGVGTITNDDPVPPQTIAIDDASGEEGTAVQLMVRLSSPPDLNESVSVDYSTQPASGSATEGTDYPVTTGTVTFTAGEVGRLASVPTTEDAIDEADETFTVTLSNPVVVSGRDYVLSDPTGEGTIVDDDEPSVTLAISDAGDVTEGDTGTVQSEFTVTKTGTTDQTVTVEFDTADGTAVAPGDYVARSDQTLTFLPGEATKSIFVEVAGDEIDEADEESFFVDLSNATNVASITDARGEGTIIDNDDPSTLAIGDVTVTEGDSGTTAANFSVTKTGSTSKTVTVDYETADGTAVAPGDYGTLTTTTLTFAPGEDSKTVTVDVVGDTADEDTETFFVNLTNATNASILDGQGLGTIEDDDAGPPPTISINNDKVRERAGKECLLTVTLSSAATQSFSVDYATKSGTAGGRDFVAESGTLTFAEGETSKEIGIAIKGDSRTEGTERFKVLLSNIQPADAATFADSKAVCAIIER